MRETDAVEAARRALGARLAAYRRAAGLSQAQLAGLASYSRSTVANVETGHQHVPGGFWVTADDILHADGALIQAGDAIEVAVRRERIVAARQADPLSLSLIPDSSLAPQTESAAAVPARPDDGADMVAAAAGRGHRDRPRDDRAAHR